MHGLVNNAVEDLVGAMLGEARWEPVKARVDVDALFVRVGVREDASP